MHDDRAGRLGRPVKHDLALKPRGQHFIGGIGNVARLVADVFALRATTADKPDGGGLAARARILTVLAL
jgi:hypothetical protein